MAEFRIIQGGMGAGVSNWVLAREVSRQGQLGVVSGTGLGVLVARRLQDGDPDGHMRRALAAFPFPAIAQRMVERYYIAGGRAAGQPYRSTPMPSIKSSVAFDELTVTGNFVEVYLAKEGHSGVVGINYLEKIQTPTLASIFGAMLAGVDYVLMGAGIPRFIPGVLDGLARGEPVELRMDVTGAQPGEVFNSTFDPAAFCGGPAPALRRPRFLAIISSATLAMTLARKSNGQVDGFVVELAVAGGHNAPPRGQVTLSDKGEPVYGERDVPDLEKIRDLGLPFYMAGGYATPEQLAAALALGASGVQVGTVFAFCEESGIDPEIKRQVRAAARRGETEVFTDPQASPTGFPFKVLQVEGSLSQAEVYEGRIRICDLGYLRRAYRKEDGTVGYMCAAEPVEDYVKKGGPEADTVGRKCLCNGLFGTLGMGQVDRTGYEEPAIVTSGDDVATLGRLLSANSDTYTAGDVLAYLLGADRPAAAAEKVESAR